MTERERAILLATKIAGLSVGMRYGYSSPKVHPKLSPEDRDLVVKALEYFARADVSSMAEKSDG